MVFQNSTENIQHSKLTDYKAYPLLLTMGQGPCKVLDLCCHNNLYKRVITPFYRWVNWDPESWSNVESHRARSAVLEFKFSKQWSVCCVQSKFLFNDCAASSSCLFHKTMRPLADLHPASYCLVPGLRQAQNRRKSRSLGSRKMQEDIKRLNAKQAATKVRLSTLSDVGMAKQMLLLAPSTGWGWAHRSIYADSGRIALSW